MTSIGLVIAALLYPVESKPYELGIAVIVISVVIHFGLYMIISSLTKKQVGNSDRLPLRSQRPVDAEDRNEEQCNHDDQLHAPR